MKILFDEEIWLKPFGFFIRPINGTAMNCAKIDTKKEEDLTAFLS